MGLWALVGHLIKSPGNGREAQVHRGWGARLQAHGEGREVAIISLPMRLLHNLVTSFVGMKFFGASLSRRLPSGNTLDNSNHRDSRAMNPAINTAMTTASAASERRAGQPV